MFAVFLLTVHLCQRRRQKVQLPSGFLNSIVISRARSQEDYGKGTMDQFSLSPDPSVKENEDSGSGYWDLYNYQLLLLLLLRRWENWSQVFSRSFDAFFHPWGSFKSEFMLMGSCLAPQTGVVFPAHFPYFQKDDGDEIEHTRKKKKWRKKQLAHNCSTRGGFLSRCCHLELCSSKRKPEASENACTRLFVRIPASYLVVNDETMLTTLGAIKVCHQLWMLRKFGDSSLTSAAIAGTLAAWWRSFAPVT